VIDGEVITPALEGSLLPGITRDSTIELLKSWGMKVSERKLSIQEVYEAQAQGKLDEAFGTGTAAVISPIGELNWDGNRITINYGQTGPLAARIYEGITGIQSGKIEDVFGWTVEVK
jgi:branched-chain amino acid aminotransferase